MTNLLAIACASVALFQIACGSSVTLEEKTGNAAAGGGTSVSIATVSSAATSGGGGMEQKVRLLVEFSGPESGSINAGQNTVMYKVTFTTFDHAVQIYNLSFKLASVEGAGYVAGTKGTKYFSNLKLVTSLGEMKFGPQELPPGAGAHSSNFSVTGTYQQKADSKETLALSVKLANVEDAAGEFFGRGFVAILEPFAPTDVMDLTKAQPMDMQSISPQTPQSGKAQMVMAP